MRFYNVKVIEKPALSEISKYIPSSESMRIRNYPLPNLSTAKSSNDPNMTKSIASFHPSSHYTDPISTSTVLTPKANNDLLHFIEKQEGYIEQLERESKFCRVKI